MTGEVRVRVGTSAVALAATVAMVAVGALAAAQPPAPGPEPGPAEQPQPAPPGTPYRIGYVSTAESAPAGPDGEPADVWSADESGGDRRNHTARPELRDDGPAYSPDGFWLAYSAHTGDGARIVVADAEGRDGRTLAPAGTLATDRDLDPTWSPDGTMLAFTRERDETAEGGAATSEILVVRVADGVQVGRVPMPPYLQGRDFAPAWSPDGTRIAFARTASRLPPPVADPPTVDVPATPGGVVEVPVDVLVPVIPAHPDVVFLIDGSQSMQDAIDDVAANVTDIAAQVLAQQPTARFAVAAYRDGEFALAEEVLAFEVLQPLTEDPGELVGALSSIAVVGGGADGPEDWIYPLHQLATGTPDLPEADRITFAPGRTPIVILVGDASSKEPSVGPGPPHRLNPTEGGDGDTMLALLAAGVIVVAVDVDSGSVFGDGLNGDRTRPFLRPPVPGQGTLVAERTGGRFVPPGVGPGAVSEAVREGLLGIPVPVEALVDACDAGVSATIAPPSQGVRGGEAATFTVTLTVAGAVPAGTVLRCTIGYLLGDGSRVVQQVAVRITGAGAPRVRVDDQIAQTSDPAGAVVEYEAVAVDASGGALTPACTPASGTRFPVGQTLVTCTATDSGGVVGSDTALISVVLGPADGTTRLWAATVVTEDGTVAVTDQVDLSARIVAAATERACGGRGDDTAPAWSPDAAAVVFVDTGEDSVLCVVEVAGAAVRELPSAGQPRAPAWSPDGLLVGFEVDRPPADELWTVPADGSAEAEPLIAGGGHHGDPAFRLLPPPVPPDTPALRLTATVLPNPGFVGGDRLTVRYTVRNGTTAALADAVLTAELPTALPATAAPGCESATRCTLGPLPAGAAVEVLVRLAPDAAVNTVATGEVTGSTSEGQSATATATAPVVVVEPALEISPVLGPPGLVAQATGTGFPAGGRVRLVWRDGITATADTVTVAPDGSFTWPALVFPKDTLGARELHAERDAGPRFGTATADFLVVPATQQPPLFDGRGW